MFVQKIFDEIKEWKVILVCFLGCAKEDLSKITVSDEHKICTDLLKIYKNN